MTRQEDVSAARVTTAPPLVTRRYIDLQRTCSATCRRATCRRSAACRGSASHGS